MKFPKREPGDLEKIARFERVEKVHRNIKIYKRNFAARKPRPQYIPTCGGKYDPLDSMKS